MRLNYLHQQLVVISSAPITESLILEFQNTVIAIDADETLVRVYPQNASKELTKRMVGQRTDLNIRPEQLQPKYDKQAFNEAYNKYQHKLHATIFTHP